MKGLENKKKDWMANKIKQKLLIEILYCLYEPQQTIKCKDIINCDRHFRI